MIKNTFIIFLFAGAIQGVYSQTPDFANDIAPIFYNKCTSCHHTGGIAPFSLTDYTTAYTNRYNIQYAVQTGKMPPWHPILLTVEWLEKEF